MTRKIYLAIFGFLVFLGLFTTAGHYLSPRPTAEMLQQGFYPPGPEWFLQQLPLYDQHAITTALHIVPSFLFMLLVAEQLSGKVRRRHSNVHRWLGRGLSVLGILIGISGLVLGATMPFGGGVEMVAVFLIGAGFLFSLIMGVTRIRQRRVTEHRFWMLHMAAFAFTPITMRLLLTITLFSTSISAPAAFGPTMLVGMAINLLVLQFLILRRHMRGQHDPHSESLSGQIP